MTVFYKVLGHDGSARIGSGKWHLPKGKRPGKWMEPIKGDLVACRNGYHLCRRSDLIEWLGPAIFVVEYRGEVVETMNKIVVREARLLRKLDTWNDRTARLFACDCAERVLSLYEKYYPDDSRVRNCIEITRKVANGDLPVKELTAAWYAARSAARSAAWDAARSAARSAAWDAARSAARSAAWYAARNAECEWQINRLFEYLEGTK